VKLMGLGPNGRKIFVCECLSVKVRISKSVIAYQAGTKIRSSLPDV
jgi:hypothetical protein